VLAHQFWELAAGHSFDHLHVWQRDRNLPGDKGFEPGPSPLADEVAKTIAAAAAVRHPSCPAINAVARVGQRVLDCILLEPTDWWVGFHTAQSPATRWPGGVYPEAFAPHAISRAYVKMKEALAWSDLPIAAGDLVADIGCAPGGAAQALLEQGIRVLGIDPADVDEVVRSHPNFIHVQKRAADLKRREFAEVNWLVADSNVAPSQTLAAVEGIVTHARVHIRGMLLTLKLADWKLADEIPSYLERIREWGYRDVRARQLSFNRREICVAAMPSRAQRRVRRKQAVRRAPHR
jgi:23S rRNA (cytidine2498-2'-O)-methyltransferase